LLPCANDLIETRTRHFMPRGCARIGLPAPHDDIDVERIEFEPIAPAAGALGRHRTIWLFREKLTKVGAISRLFERFDAMLRKAGYIAMRGQIVDASLIAAPRQRTTGDEKKTIKEGRIPDAWADAASEKRQPEKSSYRAYVHPLVEVCAQRFDHAQDFWPCGSLASGA
jgi:hypothetical protein